MTQRLVRLLAADVHELRREFAQRLHRYLSAVDVAPGASLAGHDAPQQAILLVIEVLFGQAFDEVGPVRQIESGGDLATRGSCPYGA